MAVGLGLIKTFCVPVKPTAKNGQRTRTLPHHQPEKWNLFKEYCRQEYCQPFQFLKQSSDYGSWIKELIPLE
jgi:DNA polymerase